MSNAEAVRKYRERNLERVNARARECMRKRRANPALNARIRAARNASGKKHYAALRQKQPYKMLVHSAKWRAKEKEMPFDLSVEWAAARWTGKCELTGIDFDLQYGHGRKGGRPRSPSLDRKDASAGYTQGNCRFILHALNMFKGESTDEEMLSVAKALLGGPLVQSIL